ncbi:Rieske (2Fe-2S) protein [Paenibacillus doosanensis]|uniref:Rieske (2Fe-2S) protein n=1 Tax=Paenibacillus doosanensis TaxID=1229154 RepID=UPI00287B5DE2|nr:Rieske 2Fe-2S domain-containing protein [Paenibacillus doosanensis]
MKTMDKWTHAGSLEALKQQRSIVIKGGIAVFYHEDNVYAVDNRCPHLGFPLHMGSLCEGILTCHWHHARFDVCSGGTLDPWADDVSSHEVLCADGEIWVNPLPKNAYNREKYMARLQEGLEQNIGIVIAKAVVGLMESGVAAPEIARAGIAFGVQYGTGWGADLTILTAMTRILPKLDKDSQILALYHGLHQVAGNRSSRAERHLLTPLPASEVSEERLIAWYRNCLEVRDTQGAQRVLLTAIRRGFTHERIMEMMLLAVTDHFYLDGGHTLDFHNKAFEALALADPSEQERILTSLVPLLGNPTRSEELHQWQSPVNLVEPLKQAFLSLEQLNSLHDARALSQEEEERLLKLLLGDQPLETIQAITDLLTDGCSPVQIAQFVALAAAERICRFHTQNDFGDWIAVLHTFTYAHAVHEILNRSRHPLLLRAVYYGAVSLYLDRFLNVPAAPKPKPKAGIDPLNASGLLDIMDKRQQVNEAFDWVAGFLQAGGEPSKLINALGHALLREDAEFHSFQMLEAAIAEYERWDSASGESAERAKQTLLFAATRYLAAHAPTPRDLPRNAKIAWRLHKGEKLFEES